MLVANNITVCLSSKNILHGVSFCARPGEITAIVGPNGSGKTTLIRVLTADLRFSGTLSLNGRDITHIKPWELATIRGVLPQSTPLAFPFTVVEVVQMGLMSGISAGRTELPIQALQRVDMASFAGRFYQELSGGEQQRVQLARVLCQIWEPMLDGQPRWLFLDEPVASLDIAHQLQVMKLVQNFAQDGGGVVMVMHDLNLTALFAHNITMLKDGIVVASGSVADVFSNANLSQAYSCKINLDLPIPPGVIFLHPATVNL